MTERKGWRWTQWTLLFALAGVLPLTLSMSETYKRVILDRRAATQGVRGPSPPEQARTMLQTVSYWLNKTVGRPVHMFVTETTVTLFDLYVAFNFGALNGFFAAFPYVFALVYGFDLGEIGLTFLGQAVGSIAGLLIVVLFDKFYYQPTSRRRAPAKMAPEQRLFMAMIGAPLVPVS